MAGMMVGGDALSHWLEGEGRAGLDGIIGEALDVVGVIDRGLNVRYLNWAVAGITRDAIVGTSVLDLVPPSYREIARQTYLDVLRTGKGTRFETMYADGDTLLIWDVRVGPIRCGEEVIGLVAITNDVTEQRREQADRDRFFALSLDMFVVVSPKGCFKRTNPAFGQTLGYATTELVAMPFIEVVHPDDRGRALESFARVLQGAPLVDFENRCLRKNGGDRVLSWRATVDPVTGDVYGVARDITEQRAMESQLRHAQKMEAVGQLAGGIAHDFNNLLLAILGNAEAAKTAVPKDSLPAECLGEIDAAGRRAANLVNQLLAFSRRQPLHPVATDLNQLTQGLMKMLRRLIPENITIAFDPAVELPAVDADPAQLEQVIVNLCVNAREAMDRGGRLTIQTESIEIDRAYCEANPWAKPGHYVQLSVRDTGMGMTDAVRERAFEPFFSTKGVQRGNGLGLATIYGIVQQHRGLVHVDSQVGAGTSFRVFLPARTAPAAQVGDVPAATKVEEKRGGPAPGAQETILLAEDEERVRRVIVLALERAGYRTVAAANGREAIRLLNEQKDPIRLVILDVVMPELGGPETWEQMRTMRRDLRVLFTSGYADASYLTQLPPDADVLGKPFRMEELVDRVRRKLNGAA